MCDIFNECMMILWLKMKPLNVNLIQVYATTTNSNESEVETFYANLELLIKNIKKQEVTMIMGNYNVEVG